MTLVHQVFLPSERGAFGTEGPVSNIVTDIETCIYYQFDAETKRPFGFLLTALKDGDVFLLRC